MASNGKQPPFLTQIDIINLGTWDHLRPPSWISVHNSSRLRAKDPGRSSIGSFHQQLYCLVHVAVTVMQGLNQLLRCNWWCLRTITNKNRCTSNKQSYGVLMRMLRMQMIPTTVVMVLMQEITSMIVIDNAKGQTWGGHSSASIPDSTAHFSHKLSVCLTSVQSCNGLPLCLHRLELADIPSACWQRFMIYDRHWPIGFTIHPSFKVCYLVSDSTNMYNHPSPQVKILRKGCNIQW